MKKLFTKLLTVTLLLLFGVLQVDAVNSASATWSFGTNLTNTAITGNVSAATATIGSGLAGTAFSQTFGTVAGWSRIATTAPNLPAAYSATSYVEYTMAPLVDNSLTVNSITLNLMGGGSGGVRIAAYYSLDGFATQTAVGTATHNATAYAATTTTPIVLINSGTASATIQGATSFTPSIAVSNGQTLKIRFYAWSTSTLKYLAIRNIVFSGITTPVCTSAAIASVTAPSSAICASATQTLGVSGLAGTSAVVTWWTGAGGTGTNLGTGTTSPAVGPGTYYARVTAACDLSVAEASTTVTTLANTSIGTQPVGASYTQYATPTALNVAATGASLTYQWYSNTSSSESGATLLAGATNSTYTPSTSAVADTYYYCVVTGTCTTITSDIVAVNVAAATSPVVVLTSGTATQNITEGTAIGNIVYIWAGTATSASVTWTGTSGSSTPPTGITVDDNSGSGPVTISGTPTVAGTYGYSIISTDGSSNYSDPSTGTITVKLTTPTVSAATSATNQGFTANWTDVTGESSYTVKVYQGASLVATIPSIAADATSEVITGLSANTTYTFTVTAIGDGSLVPNSNESVASASVRTLSTAKAITVFNLTSQISSSVNEGAKTITVLVPYGTDKSALTPSTITVSAFASVDPGTGTAQNFTSAVNYTVTAEDGSTQIYAVSVELGSVATDYFRSKASGLWSDASTWESSPDNSNWIPATSAPGLTATAVTILSPNVVEVNANTSIGTTTIDAGANLKTTGTAVVTVGAAKTLTVNGTFENNGSVSDLVFSSATAVNFNSGSTYLLSGANLFIPGGTTIISWNANSTINITGGIATGTMTTVAGTIYGNITFNTSTPTGTIILFSVGSPMQRIAGNLNVTNIGTGLLQLISSGGTNIFAIDGNYTQSAGIVLLNPSSYAATTFRPCAVKGNFTLNGGIFRISNGTANTYLIVEGNMAINNSAILENAGATNATGAAYVHLAGANSTFTRSATSSITATTGNMINVVVNSGSAVNVGDCVIDGGSNVTFTTSGAYTAPVILGTTVTSSTNNLLTVTNSASLTGIQPGMAISGTGIPADTYVTAVYSATQLQISKGTTAAGTGVTFTVTPASSTAAKLNVAAGKKLTVSTAFTNNGTVNLLSDATGTATILTPATISGTGTANVQQYLTGALTAELPSGRFWYLSSPVTGATGATFDAVGRNKAWSYTESSHGYTEIVDNATSLAVGTGYAVRMGADTTVTFTGTLNNGDKTISLTRNDGNEKSGYNLIGNPYPSFLDWHAATVSAEVLPSSIWTRSCTAGGLMAFDTYNSLLNTGVSGSGKTVTQYIAPMQAFWVKVTTGNTTGSVNFTNSMRLAQDATLTTNLLKAPSVATQQLVRLQVSNGTNSDETVIAFNANATDGFDTFDSPKMSNSNVAIPEIYTLAGTEKVAINGMKNMATMPLGFTTGEFNSFSIKATEISNFDADTRVILKDNLLNTELELNDGSAYSFTSDVVSSTTRFSIVFKTVSITTGIDNNFAGDLNVNIFKNANGLITVNSNDIVGKEGIVTVSNAIGQKLVNTATTGTRTVINKTFSSGVYFVTLNVAGNNITKKVIIN